MGKLDLEVAAWAAGAVFFDPLFLVIPRDKSGVSFERNDSLVESL